jgi:hypothetical protein
MMTVEVTAIKPIAKRPLGHKRAVGHLKPINAEARDKIGKSRITNGRDVLPNVDGRSLIARRYRDICSAILVDQGGEDACSESRKQLIRRFSAAAVIAEQMESRLANGEEISIGEHALLCSTLVRVARQIGVNRIARDVSPSLADIIQQADAEP